MISRRAAGPTLLLVLLSLTPSGCDRAQARRPTAGTTLVASRADLDRFGIGGESRAVLRGKTHRFPVTVPADAALEVGFGVPGTGNAKRGPADIARVKFSVTFVHDGTRETLARRRLERPPDGADAWHELTVDLRPLAGRRGTLVLAADAYPPTVFLPPLPLLIDGEPVFLPRPPPVVWTVPRLRHPAAEGPPNLVVISIDTLRADHLGCYG